ncbi:MAG TPA: CBS domain-containing protein [Acidimicrobiales bacterium]|nr:CBS domain-containing protein [Acidimicrobiales bacterium]
MSITLRDRAREVTRPPVLVAPGDSLRRVARTLWEQSVGAAVVGTAEQPVGVISERDVVTQLAQGADAGTAEHAMTRRVISARPDDPLLDVAFLMLDDVIRHVPLVNEDGTVTGMVSMRDLLQPLLIEAAGR